MAAEGSSCTGRHCPAFQSCSYYERRKELVAAQVIVVNHDLLLSSLGARLLPELDNCLLVLDEAHHLPATALAQFASSMDLSRLQWLDKLTSRALRIGQLLEVEEIADIPQHSGGLRQPWASWPRPPWRSAAKALKPQARFGPAQCPHPRGVLPKRSCRPLEAVWQHSTGLLDVLRAIAKALRSTIKETPDEAPRLAALYAQLGSLAPRLEAVFRHPPSCCCTPQPQAKPLPPNGSALEMDGEWIALQAHTPARSCPAARCASICGARCAARC